MMNGQLNIDKTFCLPNAIPLGDFEKEILRLGGKPYITFKNGYVFNQDQTCINPYLVYEFKGARLFFKFRAALFKEDIPVYGWEYGMEGLQFQKWFHYSEVKFNNEVTSSPIDQVFYLKLNEFLRLVKNPNPELMPNNKSVLYNINIDISRLDHDYQNLFAQQSLF